ncbi:MAG: hypothetical protein Fur0025_02290 [Oscillatoriaceae cyanobacterium]
MDRLKQYSEIIEKILIQYTLIPYAYGEIKTEFIVDKNAQRYLLINVGWQDDIRIHGCLVYIEIIGDKIWIQYDGTEDGIATELVAAGIPKDQIVLGFHPAEVRPYTDYAVQ